MADSCIFKSPKYRCGHFADFLVSAGVLGSAGYRLRLSPRISSPHAKEITQTAQNPFMEMTRECPGKDSARKSRIMGFRLGGVVFRGSKTSGIFGISHTTKQS